MRNSFQTIIAALLLIGSNQSARAQTFSTMSENERNAKLTQIALKVYKAKKISKYYSNYGYSGKYEITPFNKGVDENDKASIERDKILGKLQYIVKLYSKPGAKWGSFTIAKVYVSDKSGKAWSIMFGNDNMVYSYWNCPEPFK